MLKKMYFIILSLLINKCISGRNLTLHRRVKRIVNGVPAPIDELPYQVSIYFQKQFKCSGTIIGSRWVLTAAHCLSKDITKMLIHAGSYSNKYELKNNKVVVSIIETAYYPNGFDESTYDYDIALLKTEINFEKYFQNHSINIKSIAITNKSIFNFRNGVISGWGKTSEYNLNNVKTILKATVKIFSKFKCKKLLSLMTDRMFCAGDWNGLYDACDGDSGGPLVSFDGKLIGIISWGLGCGRVHLPGIYTDVYKLRNFVKYVIEKYDKDKQDKENIVKESSATTTTTTGTSSSSSSSESSSSSSDSSSDDSESGCSTEDENEKHDENEPFSLTELEPIYKSCVKNLEECVTRFPEHYKSIYRLVHHYLNAPDKLKNIPKCHQLLIGNYTTSLGNQIAGLFADRKNNNFFNGIWRIPSSEIDRPGSFSTHLVKCVNILLEVLRKDGGHNILIDMALQLHRTPDQDKRYIRDFERKELCKQALAFCVQVMRDILKKNQESRIDAELIELLLDIYTAHKKCIKHMNQKEALFSQLLVDAYKFYMEDKVKKLPESCNFADIAIRFCVQEISRRKSIGKYGILATNAIPDLIIPTGILNQNLIPPSSISGLTTTQISINELNNIQQGIASRVTSPASGLSEININTLAQQPGTNVNLLSKNTTSNVMGQTPNLSTNKPSMQFSGLPSRPRGRPVGSNKNSPSTILPNLINIPSHPTYPMDASSIAALMAFYGNPALSTSVPKDSKFMNNFFSEFYKFLGGAPAINPSIAGTTTPSLASTSVTSLPKTANHTTITPNLNVSQLQLNQLQKSNISSSLTSPSQFATQPTLASSPKLPQFDIKNLIASAASQVAQTTQSSSATITVGSGELTITPANTKSSGLLTSKQISDLSNLKAGSSSPILSVTKVHSQKSPGLISVKPLSDLTGPPKGNTSNISKLPILPDLPKSLTITPAMPTAQQQSMLQMPPVTHSKQQKQGMSASGKIKSKKSTATAADFINNPYKRSHSTGSIAQNAAEIFLNPLSAAAQLQLTGSSNFNASTYAQQASLLSAYADMLKQVGLESNKELLSQISKTFNPNMNLDKGNTKKSTAKANKSPAAPKVVAIPPRSLSTQNTNNIPVSVAGTCPSMPSIGSSNKFVQGNPQMRSTSFADAFVASLSGNTGSPCYNRPGPVPSPSPSTQISPTKTLQQKLAEQKQKANQMIAKNSAGPSGGNQQQNSSKSSSNDVDIIILD